MSGQDVDTRSDIYALGAMLYELLTGTPPIDQETLRKASLDEIRRLIRGTDPPRPSTRIARLAIGAPSPIANQKSKIANDLDWIVMKCLEKDRRRRYETANGLAMDLQRFLNHEPVLARPPSNLYRLQMLIPVLAVLLLPASSVAKAQSLSVACSTHLEQLHPGAHLHALDLESRKAPTIDGCQLHGLPTPPVLRPDPTRCASSRRPNRTKETIEATQCAGRNPKTA